jgi:hypothetical protein
MAPGKVVSCHHVKVDFVFCASGLKNNKIKWLNEK